MLSPWIIAIAVVVILVISLWAAGVFKKKAPPIKSRQRYHSRRTKSPAPDPVDPVTGYPVWLMTNFNQDGNNIFVGENYDMRIINLNSSGPNAKTWYEQILLAQKSGLGGADVFTRNPKSGVLNIADMTNPLNYGKGGGFLGCLPYVQDVSGKASSSSSSDTNTSTSEITKKLGGNISIPLDFITAGVTVDHTTTTKSSNATTYQMATTDFRSDIGYISMPLTSDVLPLPDDIKPSYCITNNINEQFILDFMLLASAAQNYGGVGVEVGSPQSGPREFNVFNLRPSSGTNDFGNYDAFLAKYGTHVMTKMYFGNRISLLWNDYNSDTSMSTSVFNSLCVAGGAPAAMSIKENYSVTDPGACASEMNNQTAAVQQSLENVSVEVTGGSSATSSPVLSLLIGGYKGFIEAANAPIIATFLATPDTDTSQGINFDFAPIWTILQTVFATFAAGYIPSTFAPTTVALIKRLTSAAGLPFLNMLLLNMKLAYTELNFCAPRWIENIQIQGFYQIYPYGSVKNVMDDTGAPVPNPLGMTSQCWTSTGPSYPGDGTGCTIASDCANESAGSAAYSLPTGNTLVDVPYGYSCVKGGNTIDPTVMTHVPISDPLGPTSWQYEMMQSPGSPSYSGCFVTTHEVCVQTPSGPSCYKEYTGNPGCNNVPGELNFFGPRTIWNADDQLDTCGNLAL